MFYRTVACHRWNSKLVLVILNIFLSKKSFQVLNNFIVHVLCGSGCLLILHGEDVTLLVFAAEADTGLRPGV